MPVAARSPSPLSQGLATGLSEFKMPQIAPPTTRFSPMAEELEPRRLHNKDVWTLYHFQDHAHSCRFCHNPLKVHQEGRRLCRQGTSLAEHVADLLFSKDDASVIYYAPAGRAHRLVRVRLPNGYTQVHSLLRAFESSLHNLDRLNPLISHDRIYYVPPRPIHPNAVRQPRRPSPPPRSRVRQAGDPRRSSIIVQPPSEEPSYSSRPQRRAPRETNYRAPSVEDDDGDDDQITPVPMTQAPPPPATATATATAATATPSSPTVDAPAPRTQHTQTRQRPSRTSSDTPPSPRRPVSALSPQFPPVPEPPRTERAAPTDYAYYETELRQPPGARQSQSGRRRGWRHSTSFNF